MVAGGVPVAVPQGGQRAAVAAAVQDALQHHVIAVVQREPNGLRDQRRCGTAGQIPLAQQDAA
ncbi:hypothetical protein A8711_18025 [Micromonospora sp. II]|nr:hypothetical protein A8711_18025 [Micromonospora sp. II]